MTAPAIASRIHGSALLPPLDALFDVVDDASGVGAGVAVTVLVVVVAVVVVVLAVGVGVGAPVGVGVVVPVSVVVVVVVATAVSVGAAGDVAVVVTPGGRVGRVGKVGRAGVVRLPLELPHAATATPATSIESNARRRRNPWATITASVRVGHRSACAPAG
ncbi:MAG TPA: hypothetical protein VI316_00615 [Candidatus Dormibacteraeota bacterium]